MRKDKGLNGDLDRLPMLTWIMFLKFLDDLELQREGEAKLAGKKFKPAIEPPYRWRDWAAQSDGITGDELLAFINQEECTLPERQEGRGPVPLPAHAHQFQRRRPARCHRHRVSRACRTAWSAATCCAMSSTSSTASTSPPATSCTRWARSTNPCCARCAMRRAIPASSTPRAPSCGFMVAVTDPRLGETVLDPASGTGGFLVEAFNHLSKQVKTVADRKRLAGTIALRLRTQDAAVSALPDEPAVARPRRAAD